MAAVTLSHRYIHDRFLPDKAIDLVDEAAARLSIQVDSLPYELDTLERRMASLQIEKQALRREKDQASPSSARECCRRSWPTWRSEATAVRARWQSERDAIKAIQALKREAEDPARRSGTRGKARATTTRPPSSSTAGARSGAGDHRHAGAAPRDLQRAAPSSRRRWTRRTSPSSSPSGRASPCPAMLEGEKAKLLVWRSG